MEKSITFEDFITFIREQVGLGDAPINASSLIEDDLGVTGYDAKDLINEYSNKYKVDISGFDFDKYFYSEPSWFSWKSKKKSPITVGDLYDGLINKKLY